MKRFPNMSVSEGEFILVDYTVYVKETGNIVDTTSEELAKKENVYDPNKQYGPQILVIGKGWLHQVVENEIKGMNINEEKTIEIPPEKAFGTRDPSKVKVFSLRDFHRRGYSVNVGDVVEIGGVKGVVKSINGGRVVVDFNHPLAGKTLVYRVKVVSRLENIVDKIRHLASRHLRIPVNEVEVEYSGENKEVVINIHNKYMSKPELQYGKVALASDILDLFKEGIDRIVFKEVVSRTKEQ